uniref:Uncharacterized protein n=1 Tax=Panagrolaimus sp. PS1159 TaxID=55785 RepID=A0AC35ER79_9BILA
LSAHDLPDLEEWSEENPSGTKSHSSSAGLPPKSPISPQNAHFDNLQPIRKISIISPNNHGTHTSPYGIDVFFAAPVVQASNSTNQ